MRPKVSRQLLLKCFCVVPSLQTGSTGQSGFSMPAGLPILTCRARSGAGKGLDKKKKTNPFRPFCADTEHVERLLIIYGSHNCGLCSNLIWAYEQAKDKRGKQKGIDFSFYSPPQMKGRWSGSIFAEA